VSLPGFRGVDHCGFTVPDMEQAVRFFVDVLGCEEFYSLGPFRDDDGDSMQRFFNLHPRTVVEEIRLLRCGNLNFELFQCSAPERLTQPPTMADVGGQHLAFYVDDIDAAVAHLERHDVRVLGEKLPAPGPEAGLGAYFVYFLSPWGMTLELISYPNGRAYEREHSGRLWNPARPDLA
jgi:catechol 2,3-dioxygenase-like lactoylglutathione lyase family enzyme